MRKLEGEGNQETERLGFMYCIDARYIQDHFPGIGRYTYNLIAALARVAPNEKFLALYNPALKNTRYDIAALASYPNVKLQRVDIPTVSAREQFELSSIIRRSRSALVHSPYFIKPYWLLIPSVVTIFDLIPLHYPNEIPNAALRPFFRYAVSLAARTSKRVIVPSETVRDDLAATLHVKGKKLAVIPLAADARFKPIDEPEAARVREKHGLPEKYLLYVGINKPHKNLKTLIDAWGRLRLALSLVVAGAWDARHRQASERADPIKWIRNVDDDDLPALYSGATMFVMPSLYEGFGLPLLEAMACGAPVISSDVSSLREVGGDAPLYFEPSDTRGLALLISRLFNDRVLQAELRDKSLARAKEFSWERTAQETLAVYRSIAR